MALEPVQAVDWTSVRWARDGEDYTLLSLYMADGEVHCEVVQRLALVRKTPNIQKKSGISGTQTTTQSVCPNTLPKRIPKQDRITADPCGIAPGLARGQSGEEVLAHSLLS